MEREKLRISRPENLLQGIQQAGESIYKSIGLGFTSRNFINWLFLNNINYLDLINL